MYDYGNARLAAIRSRFLGPDDLRRLAGSESPAQLIVQLERFDEWRAILRDIGPLAASPRGTIELGIERHRSTHLARVPRLYPLPIRRLAEALVMPLDRERALEVLRRRHGGEGAEAVSAGVTRGALLDAGAIAILARVPRPGDAVRLLGRFGLVDARRTVAIAREYERDQDWARLERMLDDAWDAARAEKAEAAGAGGETVVRLIDAERADRRAVDEESAAGPAAAEALERNLLLARLRRVSALAHRDPLGIGAVAGFVAAVDAQSFALRAVVATVARQWAPDRGGAWLAVRSA